MSEREEKKTKENNRTEKTKKEEKNRRTKKKKCVVPHTAAVFIFVFAFWAQMRAYVRTYVPYWYHELKQQLATKTAVALNIHK